MSQKSLHKRQDLELQATSFSSLPSDKHLWPRSYSEIRQEMHKSLQARLNREYVLRKPASFTKCELSAKHNRKMWVAVRKAAMNNALAQIKIEAKLKTLASRMKAEAAAKTVPLPISHIILPDIPKVLRTTSAPPISITEAMKDRDWLLKHRDVLQKTISAWINDSNGVRVGLPDSVEPYKYYIRKGNNSKLISQIMKNRTGWQKVKTKSEAHFVWSHRREMTFFRAVPSACGRPAPRVDDSRVVFSCPVKYTSPGTKAARTVSLKALGYSSILTSPSYIKVLPDSPLLNPVETRVHNRLENNVQLTHKKALFYNMKRYYTAVGDDYTNYLPLTFHISSGENDPEFLSFTSHFTRLASETSEQNQNIWIVKPGENSNQGRDIALFNTIQQIKAEIRSQINLRTGQKRTFIIQKYIERPFLYYKRKFDIRCYALITSVNGVIQGYYYPEGYLRTSSREFSLKHVWDKYTHLTNDAVQKNSEDYGKFEHGNKISYGEFQRYLDSVGPEMQGRMQEAVLPQSFSNSLPRKDRRFLSR